MESVVISVGDVRIDPLFDGYLDLDIGEAAPGVPPAAFAAENPALLEADGRVHLPVICHLVRIRDEVVLVDTGLGWRLRPGWPEGQLDRRLHELGVRAEDVRIVIHTHLHADHVGWNMQRDDDGRRHPFFPNARHVIQRAEWRYWIRSSRLNAPGNEHLITHVAELEGRAQVELVDPDTPIAPELSFVPTPGHTPGHVAVGVMSAGQRALIVGDVTHHVGQLNHPDLSPTWDVDPREAARTRSRVFTSLEEDPAAVLLTSHWAYPGAGHVRRVGSRRIFDALA